MDALKHTHHVHCTLHPFLFFSLYVLDFLSSPDFCHCLLFVLTASPSLSLRIPRQSLFGCVFIVCAQSSSIFFQFTIVDVTAILLVATASLPTFLCHQRFALYWLWILSFSSSQNHTYELKIVIFVYCCIILKHQMFIPRQAVLVLPSLAF